ncbi:MAG: hypothetical protein AAF634_11605 [Bacteroidota bacterium]
MIGVVQRNASRELFIREGQLIIKNVAAGNIDQSGSETNDWVIGEIDNEVIALPGKYKGGDRTDPGNYDNPSEVRKSDYQDL